ncbi:hypothetical protein [Merismopedia glauca]|uniref:Uncharacterized protein n=1 Tax=Merismopedia glauca CCAP 1448/3 TaxID=1296344 RepID=A0A2T1BYP0_9CYAN|nr:hypothetical protein [Merismopedia glauca]PSB01131.1 hypothetical protein C7B64_19865 [Merismopedia glauca CCAP 1448/3]
MPEKGIKNRATGCLVLIVPAAFLIVFVSSTWRFLLALAVVALAWNVWQRYEWQKLSQQINPIFQQMILANQGSITPLDLSLKSNISAQIAERYLEDKAAEFAAQKRNFEDRGTVYYFLTVKTLGNLFDESEPPPESELPTAVDLPALAEVTSELPAVVDAPRKDESTSSISEEVTAEQPSPSEEATAEQASPTLPLTEDTTEPEDSTPLNMIALPPLAGSFNQDPTESSKAQDNQIPDPWQAESALAHLKPLIQAELAKRLDVSASTVFKRREEPDFREWTMGRDPDGVGWAYSPENKEFYPVEEA